MTLAPVRCICLFALIPLGSGLAAPVRGFSHAQTSPGSNAPSAAPAKPQTGEASAPDKTNSKHPSHHKAAAQDCSNAATGKNNSSQKSCPPPKVVVKDGGASEAPVELKGSNEQQQLSSTEQLTASTEDNVKKIEGRPLGSNEQETLSQVKQFVEQSKAAIAAGDLERGHSLAMKALLLSDELVKK
jgi:hypothetical protein